MCFFECRLCSKSCSVFYLVERKVNILAKTIQQCPTYLIFDGLGPLEHDCVPRNKWKRDQRYTAVILNLALGVVSGPPAFCVLINYSLLCFSGDGVHSLNQIVRGIWDPSRNVKINHQAKYSDHKTSALLHSIMDSAFRKPG